MILRIALPAALFLAVLAPRPSLAGAPPVPPVAPKAPLPAAAPKAEDFNDTVNLNNNNPLVGVKVVGDNWRGVRSQLPAGQDNFHFAPVETVIDVEYATRPAEYKEAAELAQAGRFQEAAGKFEPGLRRLRDSERIQRQYFQAGLAECYEGLRDADKLRTVINTMAPLNVKPDDCPRLVYAALPRLGRAYFAAGKFKDAEESFDRAAALFARLLKEREVPAETDRYVNRHLINARFWAVRSMEAQGKTADAARAYDVEFTGKTVSERYPDLFAQALVGIGRCKAVKDPAEGLAYFQDKDKGLLAKLPASALPAAYCALAEAYRLRGNSEKKDELDCYQARWYYLKVIVQYPTDRAALARAYYGAGLCYKALAEQAQESGAKEKAAKLFSAVVKEFPDSPESLLAKTEGGQ